MMAVLLGEDHLVRGYSPVYSEVRVVPGYCPFGGGAVETVALVLENRLVGQDAEAVGHALGKEELEVVVSRELHGDMFPEGR